MKHKLLYRDRNMVCFVSGGVGRGMVPTAFTNRAILFMQFAYRAGLNGSESKSEVKQYSDVAM